MIKINIKLKNPPHLNFDTAYVYDYVFYFFGRERIYCRIGDDWQQENTSNIIDKSSELYNRIESSYQVKSECERVR